VVRPVLLRVGCADVCAPGVEWLARAARLRSGTGRLSTMPLAARGGREALDTKLGESRCRRSGGGGVPTDDAREAIGCAACPVLTGVQRLTSSTLVMKGVVAYRPLLL
jgi:hypothetical protein